MASTITPPPDVEGPPVYDQGAVDRAYRLHRAKRFARMSRRRETRRARLRFWAVLAALVLGLLVLAVTIWGEVEQLFGL
jgi:hypothetical protein